MTETANYTPEQTAELINQYSSGVEVEQIAEAMGKTVRSVRSKLVREGVYIAKPKTKTAKVDGPSKKELLRELEAATGFSPEGLEGATKAAIARLIEALSVQGTH